MWSAIPPFLFYYNPTIPHPIWSNQTIYRCKRLSTIASWWDFEVPQNPFSRRHLPANSSLLCIYDLIPISLLSIQPSRTLLFAGVLRKGELRSRKIFPADAIFSYQCFLLWLYTLLPVLLDLIRLFTVVSDLIDLFIGAKVNWGRSPQKQCTSFLRID